MISRSLLLTVLVTICMLGSQTVRFSDLVIFLQSVVYSDVMVVRTSFLIQEKSEAVYFLKLENLKKGGQPVMSELTQ